jgi:hypothetical protein
MMQDGTKNEQDIHVNSMLGGITGVNFNTCDFSNSFPSSVGLGSVEKIKLKYASAPNLFDNIYAGNSVLYYNINAGPTLELTVPHGFYSLDDLAAILTTLTAPNVIFTVVGRKINIANANAIDTINMLGTLNLDKAKPGVIASMNEAIGIGRIDMILAPLSDADTTFLPALFGPQNAFISCNTLAHQHSIHDKSQARSIIGCIPLSSTVYGNVASITFPESSTHQIVLKSESNPSFVAIQLQDHLGQQLSLPPNMHPHIVFTASEITT